MAEAEEPVAKHGYDHIETYLQEPVVTNPEYPKIGDGQFPIGDTLVTSQMSCDIITRH